MRFEASIYIDRSTDDVFAFIADHANDHLWRDELVSSSVDGDVQGGVGMRLSQTVSFNGRTAEAHLEVTEFEPGTRICFKARGGLRAHGCYELRPEGAGTRLLVLATAELKGSAAMLERYVRQTVEQAASADLQRLKLAMESSSS